MPEFLTVFFGSSVLVVGEQLQRRNLAVSAGRPEDAGWDRPLQVRNSERDLVAKGAHFGKGIWLRNYLLLEIKAANPFLPSTVSK